MNIEQFENYRVERKFSDTNDKARQRVALLKNENDAWLVGYQMTFIPSNSPTWIYTSISKRRIEHLIDGISELRDVYTFPQSGVVHIVSHNLTDPKDIVLKTKQVAMINKIDRQIWPKMGTYLLKEIDINQEKKIA